MSVPGDMNLAALTGLAGSLTQQPSLPALGAQPYQAMTVPEMPPNLLGPTGKVFTHPGGYSTHLNIVTDHPMLPDRYTVAPMLVPGQIGLERLLSGQQATRGQFGRAQDSLMQRLRQGENMPAFNTVDEALKYEQGWHDETAAAQQPYLRGLIGGQ